MRSFRRYSWQRWLTTGSIVFLLCLGTGIFAGTIFRENQKPAEAASASITVVDNDQIVTQDQGTTIIQRTSTVTVLDPEATLGYKLSAQISQNTIPPTSTVSIYSPSSTACIESSPCTLSTTSPVQILDSTSTNATTAQGHTTDWTLTITLPANTSQGSYILDIAYSEEPKIRTPLQDGMNLQDATTKMCNDTHLGATVNLTDARDGKYYRVRKMVDDHCWMIDNLAYDLANTNAPTYSPSAALVSGPTAGVDTQAQYMGNNNIAGQGQIPNNGNPTPSYLYNWCAAMGDTSTNCATTLAYTAGQPAAFQTGICPAPFRLPRGGIGPTTPGNGTNQVAAAATTTNEFSKLDIWLGGTAGNRQNANTYINFTTDNTTNPQLFWLGVLSGVYYSGLSDQGSIGIWWSSTANSGTSIYLLRVISANTVVYPSVNNPKNNGLAVRCIL